MPLYATALVVSDSRISVAIIDVDAIGFDSEWTRKIVDAVVDLTTLAREQIRFSCTHTHSGPNTFRLLIITEGLDMVLSYLDGLPRRIASAVWQAPKSLKPVQLGVARGSCEINVNRRLKLADGRVVIGNNGAGPVDHTVRVVRLDVLDQVPVATLLHYACHPTIMAWQNQYRTPDCPGAARQVVEQQLGGTCLFLQGATGNVGPRQGFTDDVRVYRSLGKILGLEVAKVATMIETLPRQERFAGVLQSGAPIALYEHEFVEPDPAVLRVLSKSLKLPLIRFRPVEELEGEAAELREQLKQLRYHGTQEEIRAMTSRATQAGIRAENARIYEGKTHMSWQLQGIRLGPVALLSVPGEPFTEISQEVVAGSPFGETFFSGYSNGGFGYLPIRSAYSEGGYEVEISPFAPEAAEIIIAEGLQMLRDLAAPESNS